MRKNPQLTKQEQDIRKLLQFFLDYLPNGLLPFFGEAAYTDDETMYQALQAKYIDLYKKRHHGAVPEIVPVQGGSGTLYAQTVIEAADKIAERIHRHGGFETFYAAFDEMSNKRRMSRNMQILRELSRRGATTDTAEDIAENHLICVPQVWKAKNRALDALARNIGARCATERFLQTKENEQ